ncbi:MAG: hypothetical protein DRH17_12765, partial [Deltaproteobacteria bacterium]
LVYRFYRIFKERFDNICGITYPQIFEKNLLTFTGTTKMPKVKEALSAHTDLITTQFLNLSSR